MKSFIVALAFFAALSLLGCGAGSPIHPLEGDGNGAGYALAGIVVKGPVANATVTAYRLDASFVRGAQLATAATDTDGKFTLTLPPYSGNLLLVATSGSYTEEAVGTSVKLDGVELEYPLIGYKPGTTASGLAITPVSHWAAALTRFYVTHAGMTVADAADKAWTHLNTHFGAVDWRTISPTNFGAADGGVQLGDADRAGLLLAALSQEAADIATRDQVTAGVGFTSIDLVTALADDLQADGYFDGVGSGGPIVVPKGSIVVASGTSGTTLDGQSVRNTLALSLSRYLGNPLNRSGLSFSDAEALIDSLSADADNVLFRDGGVNFDHLAPIVTPSVAYQLANSFVDGGTPTYSPVGPSRLVGGSLRIALDATDTSGVNSLSALLGGNPLPLDVVGNTNSHLQGTYVTLGTADGPLELAWTSTDNKGNTGSGSLTYLVDNTPPTIVVAADSPRDGAFYRSTVPVDVTASDSNGIDTFTATGLDGLNDQDSAKERIAGTWSIPSSVPEGLHDLAFTACDPVHNCSEVTVPVYVDRVPPQLSFVTTPPSYTNQQQFTVLFNVTDTGSGVAHAWVQNGGAAAVEALAQGNGTYAATLTLPVGPSAISIYATDVAGNDSRSAAQFGFNIIYDNAPPSVTPQTGVQSYIPEDSMGIQTNPDGSPVMPVHYTFASGANPTVVPGPGPVYKASTRLSWGSTAPTAAQLLSQDHSTLNVPFLAYQVGYAPQTDSPVTSVRYAVHCSSNCGSNWSDATGDLLLDDTQTASLRYLLPLTSETVPGLAQLPSGGSSLSVTITTEDAAGNVGTADGGSFTFEVVGPPLLVTEDTSYVSAGDSWSVYAHPSTSSSYYFQFSSNLQQLRYARYVIQNPAPVPVQVSIAIAQHSTGGVQDTWATWESWNVGFDAFSGSFPGTYTAPDGQGPYDSSYYKHQCPGFSANLPPTSCTGTFTAWQHLPQTSGMACDTAALPTGQTGTSHVEASGTLSAFVYLGNSSPNPNAFVVPAASGTTPGSATVYLGRMAGAQRQTQLSSAPVSYAGSAALFQNIDPTGARTGWQIWNGDYWKNDPDGTVCGVNASTGTDKYNWDYPGLRHWTYLTAAKFVLNGSVSVSTRGTDGTSAFGDTRALTTQSFTRSVNN